MVDDLALIDIAIVQPSKRGGSRRIQKLGYRLKYKARYWSKMSSDFNLIPPVLHAQSAPAPRFALKSKRLSQSCEVLPIHLRDVMRAASFGLSGLKCTVGLGKAPILSVRDGRR
jgi:hypothetical protein